MLTALGKPDELKVQAAVYCGVPAALEATRHTQAAPAALADE
jgi:hypothetical protein